MMNDNPTPDDYIDNLLNRNAQVTASPRRRIPLWMIIGLVVLISIMGGILYRMFMPLEAPIPANLGASYAGLERGYTEQGFPRLGSADAPVLIEDFSSYACPHCGHFHHDSFPALLDDIAAGEVQFVLMPISHIGRGADHATKGALCAGEQGKFWEMSDVLFDWQRRFKVSVFDERRIRKGAENMGLDTEAFNRCMSDDHPKTVSQAARNEFERRGLTGTPSLFINGEKVHDYREFESFYQAES